MIHKIKVVYLLNNLSNGGIEHFLLNYLKSLKVNKKFEFSLIYTDQCNEDIKKQFEELNVNIIKTKHSINQNQLAYFFDLVRIFRKNKYDVVHCHISQNNFYGLFAGILTRVKIRISHSHMNIRECHRGNKPNPIKKWIRNSKIYFSDCLATTRLACSEIAGKSAFKKDFTVIPNAIEIDQFAYDEKRRNALRKQLKVKSEHLYGFFGRLHEDKNPIFALELFEKIKQKDPKAKFLMIGYGGLKDKVFEKILQSPHQKDIIYIESVTNIQDYYQAIDELFFPSKSEGLGMVAVEAQRSGLPVITTTNVPEEVKISNRIIFLDLNEPIETWVNTCLAYIKQDRKQVQFTKNYQNFEIQKQAKKLFIHYRKK